jgi:tetratricopeptide (TPR) repeat protein
MSDETPDAGSEPEESEADPTEQTTEEELAEVEEELADHRERLADRREELAERDEELAERDEADAEAEIYRRRVAILLAAVAVLGGWIAVLQTNAGTNESASARETTRTAVEAQSAAVVVEGLEAMKAGATAEVVTIPLRTTFTQELAAILPEEELPFTDTDRVSDGLSIAAESAQGLVQTDPELVFGLGVEQREKALQRDQLTEERITWNARASQYETVITVLGVSLFLIGFTLVLSRKVRPPILIPGLVLVIYCFGWAVWIYNKPIPEVAAEAITATATGELLLDQGETEAAVASLDEAIEFDDEYLPAYTSRSIANVSVANPDLLNTFAITDNESEVFQAAIDDAVRALELGGDEDITTLTVTAVIALAANEYEIAGEAIERAIELNDQVPALYLFASVLALANGDFEEAQEQLDDGLALIEPAEPSGRIREFTAIYNSWVGWVESQQPDLADSGRELRDMMSAAEMFLTEGIEPTGAVPPGAGIVLVGVEYADDGITTDIELVGLSEDDYVLVILYERPSVGGPWVQAERLAYVGPAFVGVEQRNPIAAVRACEPVEFRADLYVEGVFVESQIVPGVEPTC